jgi:TolB protein
VLGQVQNTAGDKFEISFWLFDVFKAKEMVALKISATDATLRRAAHKISDVVYEKLTGKKGVFSTRIAYVTAEGVGRDQKYTLWLSDWDGENDQPILVSNEPIMSPVWSPDGKRIAYTSLEGDGTAKVYIQNWRTRDRKAIETPYTYPILGAPAWSAKGDKLAFTISRNGNTDIYTLDLRNEKMRKLTTHYAIDTEPAWLPDGKTIIFTSDRGGRPQLYKVSTSGGRAERITFEGRENARASVSPDGKMIALVHKNGNGDQIATMELASGALRVLTDGRFDDSPSFAPNGSMIIYSISPGRRGELAVVTVDGFKYQLSDPKDVREPAWSPFNN